MYKSKVFVTTYTGKSFYPFNPRKEDMCIEDIAHHLSQINRWTGATTHPYSVAQHSVNVAKVLDHVTYVMKDDLRYLKIYQGLMHDATEAYCQDIASPIKALLPDYQKLEETIWSAISEVFFVQEKIFDVVDYADKAMGAYEATVILPIMPEWMDAKTYFQAVNLVNGADVDLSKWSPEKAKEEFLKYYEKYKLSNREVL